jgi:hypothetical protein
LTSFLFGLSDIHTSQDYNLLHSRYWISDMWQW